MGFVKTFGIWSSFTAKNFLVPIVFYLLFKTFGAKPAIFVSVAAALIQSIGTRMAGRILSPFFVLASGFTVAFGTLDLLLPKPWFFRFEGFAQNVILAGIFSISLLCKIPLAEKFSQALPEKFRMDPSLRSQAYLRKLTWIWSGYFFAKGVFYFYLALRVDLGQLVIWRTLVGGGSLVLLFGGEILFRRLFISQPEALQHSARIEKDPLV